MFALDGGRHVWRRRLADGSWEDEWSYLGPLAGDTPIDGFTAVAVEPDCPSLVFGRSEGSSGETAVRLVTGERAAWHSAPGSAQRLQAVAVAPGEFDLYLVDVPGQRYLRHHYSDGRPGELTDLGRPPEGGAVSPGFAAAGQDFVAAGQEGLWHRLPEDPPAWENLGGDLMVGPDACPQVAAVSRGDVTDVLALWAGTALLHRSIGNTPSGWRLVDVWDAGADGHRVLRPKDLVTLTVRSAGLAKRVRPDGEVELVASAAGGMLIVDFPPQHIAEAALNAGTSSVAFLAGSSRLCFALRQGTVTLSAEGLLEAMRVLPLVTDPTSTGQEVSRIELPWRLLSALRQGTKCVHRTKPATDAAGATELWHSRLIAGGGTGRLGLVPRAAVPEPPGGAPDTPLHGWVEQIAAAGTAHPGQPVDLDQLMLSAYGAWFAASGRWPELSWSHGASMGRDYHVEVVKPGTLFPFGHRAAYVRLVQRQFEQGAEPVAALRKRELLVVTEPGRSYGIGDGGSHERAFPFQYVTLHPTRITELDTPSWIGGWGFWPTQAGAEVCFTAMADAGQETVSLRLPLLFVGSTGGSAPSAATLDAEYAAGPRAAGRRAMGRPTTEVGRGIPLAMRSVSEAWPGAVQEVQSMAFGGVGVPSGADGSGFYPKVTQMEVGLPAVRQLIGPTPPVPAKFAGPFLQTLPGGTPPDAMLDLLEAKRLDFGSAGERAGLLAAPKMTVDQISRELGPVVGGPINDPRDLFDQDATLFGIVPLCEVIGQVRGKPKIVWSRSGGTASATLTWSEHLEHDVTPFYHHGGSSSILLTVESQLVSGRPVSHTTGQISDFSLEIPTRESALVKLNFRKVQFQADSGERPRLTCDLAAAELGGDLKFLRTIAQDILKSLGGGPRIEASSTQIKSTYSVCIPKVPLLVFTAQNLLLQSGVTLPLTDQPITIDFAFGTRERPFLVTVAGFGGGGYLELGVSAGGSGAGLRRFVGGIEFGAALAMDFGVASGEVHAFGGVVCTMRGGATEITGYLRVGGSIRVLGLIGVSIELTMSLTYNSATNELSGSARLVITVDLTFWSTSVTLSCHKSFTADLLSAGSDVGLSRTADGLPTAATPATSVETALGPQGSHYPWREYCRAFTGT
ncbi:hypothetical protein ACIPWE_35950 [Streptomyces sp. NPDC090073]|uniref:hypothetical protein n=1 Tax=Streptomyces sp. NPDC090073 TaxID=3365936 RepID=UPI0038167AF5